MLVSQKCQYALRAVFELARLHGNGPVKIADIAKVQAIPPRFLEVILNQLKQAGFLASQRGSGGGYFLVRPADQVTIGEVVRFVEGAIGPVECVADGSKEKCALYGNCVFLGMWEKVRQAIAGIYDHTTFQDLVDEDMRKTSSYVPSYAI